MRNGTRRIATTIAAGLLTAGLLASCGSSDSGGSSSSDGGSKGGASGDVIKIGYSAWPGWFPLAVADQEKIFADAGLNVELTYFADYTASLDALVAGKVDVNAQTLNDTIFGVAAGSDQKVIVVGDNSTGNDAVICDESVKDVKDLKGKTIAAEEGVVDHFLLLQALDAEGLTQDDIDFVGVKTDAAAAGFAGGQFDCVAVFAPFTVQALERKGSHVVVSSKDFPGVIPDHLVATADFVKDRPEDTQKLVDAWYATLDAIKADPKGTTAIMAKKAGLSTKEYDSLAEGTTLFTADEAMDAFEDRKGDATSLPEMARRINPFLVDSGLAKDEAPLDGLFAPEFTKAYLDDKGEG
ncbi:aliphatic sulfonate ABC transporter substrate-binding protein [Aquihabitans sp. G128]|uniref:aliphatic sulfonate ABC transporter substrate-binding protein n=1 Tax=Aquihabitans sp. G128 TaxID=2849779 RepID=UPI001C20F834|nr:aliphatic sulfonate ABC transporter substrate-binding protein [Aquihabitans sp. G128]QXC62859.1 aliphatic sulfonate ABC transporter substrate-binding protein [Aquihabitans sp. G128]